MRAIRDAAIEAAWLAGDTKTNIARRYGITPQRVSQILHERGAREHRQRIVELERQGGGWLEQPSGGRA